MNQRIANRAHLITGGYPPGSAAGHDMDYARLRLLNMLSDTGSITTTVSGDFADIEKWLPDCRLLVTYVAGPYPDPGQCEFMNQWLGDGGCWLALHGTSGGKAAKIPHSLRRTMVKMDHHQTLGSFFLNHPPLRRFTVDVAGHPLTEGLPPAFDVSDELYLLELQDPDLHVLLTTALEEDPSPEGFGFAYDKDTSLQADGKTRVLGYLRSVGEGSVIYYALGHCHTPTTNVQPFVDASIDASGTTPMVFRGAWETEAFQQLLHNAITWSTDA